MSNAQPEVSGSSTSGKFTPQTFPTHSCALGTPPLSYQTLHQPLDGRDPGKPNSPLWFPLWAKATLPLGRVRMNVGSPGTAPSWASHFPRVILRRPKTMVLRGHRSKQAPVWQVTSVILECWRATPPPRPSLLHHDVFGRT